jgi:hexosaminidase
MKMIVFLSALLFAAPAAAHTLMPVPRTLLLSGARLPIDRTFAAAVEGACDDRAKAAVGRAMRRLSERTGLEWTAGTAPRLTVRCDQAGAPQPALGEDESYTIDVAAEGAALHAKTSVGAIRGIETVLQLVDGDRGGYFLPGAHVEDAPRFPWRGLLIDVGRHFMPVDVIERNLDGMAAVKLNVLHLHLTEDQGFRVETKRYPELYQQGSDGLYYTQDQIRGLVTYAAARGIRIVPEFDMPGHVTSWLVSHPKLASAPGPYTIERHWGVFDATFDPTREETYTLLDGFLGEMAALFPDPYLHIGGDENNGKQWAANAQIQAFMKQHGLKDAHALQAHFNQRVSKILTKYRKQMVGWDEILHPDLPQTIVIQSWRGQKSLAEAARQGYRGLLSSGWYLDLIHRTRDHYLVDPLTTEMALTPEQSARVLGGEAAMWAEFVGPETIDSRIWPRLAAIAERLWSPADVRDVDDMYRRLDAESVRLEALGLQHETARGVLLRRLTGSLDPGPLTTLASLVEPVKNYRRPELRPASQMMPLTRLVDAARPDSRAARAFARAVDAFVADPAHDRERQTLAAALTAWRDVRPSIDVLIDRAPALEEARPLAADLADMGTIGLEAVTYLGSRTAPPDGWKDRAAARLAEAAKPKAELEWPALPALRTLIDAAAAPSSAAR